MENSKKRIINLIKNPKDNIGKVIPFTMSKIRPRYRRLLESLRIYNLSKPYSNHVELLKEINFRDGFFVQCGGNDGYSNDPSYYFEKVLGWNGIIVEPLPIYKLCKNNRSKSKVYNNAVGSLNDKNKKVSFIDCNAMSFIKGSIKNEEWWINAGEKTQNLKSKTIELTLTTIQQIIDNHFLNSTKKKIDLFIADTEGYEFPILNGLDFDKNSPSYILLEIYEDTELKKITDLLGTKGYKLIKSLEQRDFLFKCNK